MTTVELAIKGIKASVKFREPHSKAGVREIVLTGEVLASKVEDNPVPSCTEIKQSYGYKTNRRF